MIYSLRMDIPKLTLTNTKAEMLASYQKLVHALEAKEKLTETPIPPVSIKPGQTTPRKIEDILVAFRQHVLTFLATFEKSLTEKSQEITILDKRILELKEQVRLGEEIRFTAEKLDELKQVIEQEKLSLERYKKQQMDIFEEEKSWERHKFDRELERLRWEAQEDIERKEKQLKEREEQFNIRQRDFEALQKQITDLTKQIEKARVEGRLEGAIEAKKEYTHELALIKNQHEAHNKLAEQQIENLEMYIKDYKQEINSLKQQLAIANKQVEHLAVAALETKKQPIQTNADRS